MFTKIGTRFARAKPEELEHMDDVTKHDLRNDSRLGLIGPKVPAQAAHPLLQALPPGSPDDLRLVINTEP